MNKWKFPWLLQKYFIQPTCWQIQWEKNEIDAIRRKLGQFRAVSGQFMKYHPSSYVLCELIFFYSLPSPIYFIWSLSLFCKWEYNIIKIMLNNTVSDANSWFLCIGDKSFSFRQMMNGKEASSAKWMYISTTMLDLETVIVDCVDQTPLSFLFDFS